MKTAIGFLLCIVAFCFLPITQLKAQDKTVLPDKFPKRTFTPKMQKPDISIKHAP